MITHRQRARPAPWRVRKQSAARRWLVPFTAMEWSLEWLAYALSNWTLLEVLEYLGSFSVLVAVIFYFAESGDRVKQRHYQAWQVINTAQGKGGSGGRIEALQELNADHVSLTGVDVGGAFLRGIQLEHAHLERCDMHAADLRTGDLRFARLSDSNLQSANLRQTDLTGVDLQSAELQDVDLNAANLTKADLAYADLSRVDLRFADVSGISWKDIQTMKLANVYGMKNASAEFLDFATKHGAVSLASDDDWNVLLRQASSDQK